jgi:hypothetical protein
MCYGNLDPKHMMRDMDARLRPLGLSQTATKKEMTVSPPEGLLARLVRQLTEWKRRNARHV